MVRLAQWAAAVVCCTILAPGAPAGGPDADSPLEQFCRRLDCAYEPQWPVRFEISEHLAPPASDARADLGERIGWCEVLCDDRGRVRIDHTHPAQRRVLQGINGTLLLDGVLYELTSAPRRAVQRAIPPLHAAAMVARRAPMHIPSDVRAAIADDPNAAVDHHSEPGQVVVRAPLQGYEFSFDATDLALLSVISRRPGGRVTSYRVEEFHPPGLAFAARFPARTRTDSHIPRQPQQKRHTVIEVLTRPEAVGTGDEAFDWRRFASEMVSERGASAAGRERPAHRSDSDAMAIDTHAATPGGTDAVLPVVRDRTRTWLLALGIASVLGGLAWTCRRQNA